MSHELIAFCGPSLPSEESRAPFGAIAFAPPARCGDVLAACERAPAAIALVDGYFDHHLSVWHKEILWALRGGIRVYGAASMGALRAAELAPFGMIGVGRIFDAFNQGRLEDDDEVALVHDLPERAYRPLSVPMVNIRATIDCAAADGTLRPETAATLVRLAKARFYPERQFPTLVRDALESGVPVEELARFRDWLPDHYVDQKRLDAIEALTRMQAAGPASQPAPPSFRFEYTESWHELRKRYRHLAPPASDT